MILLLNIHRAFFDASVGNQPQNRDGDVKSERDPAIEKAKWNRSRVNRDRKFAFEIVAYRFGEGRVLPILANQREAENVERDGAHQQNNTIKRDGKLGEMIFAHPRGRKGQNRKPEQQMQIRPQHAAAHAARRVEQMVVIVPIDPDINKAENVTQKDWAKRGQRLEGGVMRHFEFQHHNGDDNGENAIAKGFEAAFGHGIFQ